MYADIFVEFHKNVRRRRGYEKRKKRIYKGLQLF